MTKDHPDARGSILDPKRNCWRIEPAQRAALIVDAADYFRIVRKAMLRARSQILMIGWDLDTRIHLDVDPDDEAPSTLGPLISWIAKHRADVRVHMLAWGGASYRLLGRGSTLFRVARWQMSDRIGFKLDSNHPREASHHQKIVVVDDALAFCGGIDITGSRWDTRDHLDDEPGRRRPTTRRAYPPWHDITMAVDGKTAEALGDLGRRRWKAATGQALPPAGGGNKDMWPDELDPDFRDIEIGIARTRGENGEHEELREIEALFVDMIASAKRFIYAENQYFASRVVAEAITKRLQEPDCPEIVLVCPHSAEGFLEEAVMGSARQQLLKAMEGCLHFDRFRLYTPVTAGGEDIYVHAKLMIVDDRMLRVGSANMNNRSMGLDTECDLLIEAVRGGPEAAERIAAIRADLMAEHLGCEPEAVDRVFAETGSLIQTVERLRGQGRSLRPFEPREPTDVEKQVARSEVADPESAKDSFEPMAKHKLLGGLRRLRRRRG